MNLDGHEIADDYIVTAERIFEFCGADSTLCVDVLMDKFAPFVKTNKAEYNYLRSLLDPHQSNPEITVSELATTLSKYSESQKTKVDLDESFNTKNALVPQDSDSGISSDGFQLLEELQCELREKAQLLQQLRRQLSDCEALHEEALASAAVERRALQEQLNMLREENGLLNHVRHDYEDVCERLTAGEKTLDDARGQLEGARKRAKEMADRVEHLETERQSLTELLSRSKAECHRINEKYASRQSALLERDETLRRERAELQAAADRDQRHLQRQLQRLHAEKILLEMELKEVLNKSDSQLRVDRSVDVSYTDDQILSALDSLNADSRFTQENRLLDEESFVNALKEDQGRPTNLSLYDEIRLSFCNVSRHSLTDLNLSQIFEKPSEIHNSRTVDTQTDNNSYICKSSRTLGEGDTYIDTAVQTEIGSYEITNKDQFYLHPSDTNPNTSTQTIDTSKNLHNYFEDKSQNAKENTSNKSINTTLHMLEVFRDIEVMNFGTQTDIEVMNFGTQTDIDEIEPCHNNNNIQTCFDCTKCLECDRLNKYASKLECENKKSNIIVQDMQRDMNMYEENLNLLKKFVDEGNERNIVLKAVVDSLRTKLGLLENACTEQNSKIEAMYCDGCSDEIQKDCEPSSVSTQTELPYADCVRRAPHRGLKRYLWNSVKWLFQVFAVVCFACAVWALCGVTGRARACPPPCAAPGVTSPWWWMHPHELLDLFLTIEYVAEVPM